MPPPRLLVFFFFLRIASVISLYYSLLVLAGAALGQMVVFFLRVCLSSFDPPRVRPFESSRWSFGIDSCYVIEAIRLGFVFVYLVSSVLDPGDDCGSRVLVLRGTCTKTFLLS